MIKSKTGSRVKTVDNGLALAFKKAASYLEGRGGIRGRLDVDGKQPDRRYRFIHKDRMNLYDGFVGDWKPLTPEDNKGEKLNRVSANVSADGLIRVGDLVLAWQPEESAKLRDAVVLYHNHKAATQIQFSGGAGIDVDDDVTSLTNESIKTSLGSNDKVLESVRAAESAINHGEAKVSDMVKEKIALQAEIEDLADRLSVAEQSAATPKIVVPENLVSQATKKAGRPKKKSDGMSVDN